MISPKESIPLQQKPRRRMEKGAIIAPFSIAYRSRKIRETEVTLWRQTRRQGNGS